MWSRILGPVKGQSTGLIWICGNPIPGQKYGEEFGLLGFGFCLSRFRLEFGGLILGKFVAHNLELFGVQMFTRIYWSFVIMEIVDLECGLDLYRISLVLSIHHSGVDGGEPWCILSANTRRRVPRLSLPFEAILHLRLIISAKAAGPTSRLGAPPVYEAIPCVVNVSTPQT